MDVKEIARVKRNVAKMISQGAPADDIEAYVSSENVSTEQIQQLPQEAVNQPVFSGSILPMSRYEDGSVKFDSDAGLLGPIKRAFQLPADVMSGKVQINDPMTGRTSDDVIGRASEFAGVFSGANPMVRSGDKAIAGQSRNTYKQVPDAPTAIQLKEAGKSGYDAMRATGAEYPAADVAQMAKEAMIKMNSEGFNDVTAPNTFRQLNDLANPPAGAIADINGLHAARKSFGKLGQKFTDPSEQAAGIYAQKYLDDFIRGSGKFDAGNQAGIPADPSGSMGPRRAIAAKLLEEANGNYAAGKRSELIGGMQTSAERRAAAANSGQNIGNTIRSKIASALDQKKKVAGFNADEVKELEGVVHGSKAANATRDASNYLGGGGGLGALSSTALGATAGTMAAGPMGGIIGAVAPPLLGRALKSSSNKMTENAFKKVDANVRKRSPLYEEMQKQAPTVTKGPTRKNAILKILAAREMEALEAERDRFNKALAAGNGA
jgi:hypothetical protein